MVNVDEVFNAEWPMVNQELFSAAQDNTTDVDRDLARAVLGAELTRRFGGVVVSAEYALEDTAAFAVVVSTGQGFALGTAPVTDVPPVLVIPRGHQFAGSYAKQLGDIVRAAGSKNANTAALDAATSLGPVRLISSAAAFQGAPRVPLACRRGGSGRPRRQCRGDAHEGVAGSWRPGLRRRGQGAA